MFRRLNIIILIFFFCSCTEYVPKPLGYPRIDRIEQVNKIYQNNRISFEYPETVVIDSLLSKDKNQIWFNLLYPQYSARIYCTYLPITKDQLKLAIEDSYRLAYSHAIKAKHIQQTPFINDLHNTYGIIYDIEGNTAVPIQFFVTDSISHFLRGSVYYDSVYNVDSILPITNYLRDDIVHMIESLKWSPK